MRWPVVHGPAPATVADLAGRKPQLVAENLLLRQQLIILNCSVNRARFTPADMTGRAIEYMVAKYLAERAFPVLPCIRSDTRWQRSMFCAAQT